MEESMAALSMFEKEKGLNVGDVSPVFHQFLECFTTLLRHLGHNRSPTLEKIIERHLQLCNCLSWWQCALRLQNSCTEGVELQKMRFAREGAMRIPIKMSM